MCVRPPPSDQGLRKFGNWEIRKFTLLVRVPGNSEIGKFAYTFPLPPDHGLRKFGNWENRKFAPPWTWSQEIRKFGNWEIRHPSLVRVSVNSEIGKFINSPPPWSGSQEIRKFGNLEIRKLGGGRGIPEYPNFPRSQEIRKFGRISEFPNFRIS